MKKIVLMLLAMVVFGNVLSQVNTFHEVDVKTIYVLPDATIGYRILFFDVEWVGSLGQEHYYELDATGSANPSEYRKIILSALYSAKANGNKVKVYVPRIETNGKNVFNQIMVMP